MKSLILPYQNDRPAVTLQLKTKEKHWKFFTALVDSGADFSIFPAFAAIVLGIEVEKLPKTTAESADGDLFEIHKATLTAKLYEREFFIPIGFSKKQNVTPIIGRAGFFDTFKIEFDEKAKQLSLTPYSK